MRPHYAPRRAVVFFIVGKSEPYQQMLQSYAFFINKMLLGGWVAGVFDMKRLLLFLSLVPFYTVSYAQSSIAERCLEELKPKMEFFYMYLGMSVENIKIYTEECSAACEVIDKYVPQLTDIDEKFDLLWAKVDLLSVLLEAYLKFGWESSKQEYITQSNRMVSTLENMERLASQIKEKSDWNLQMFNIKEALGEHYFQQKNYQKAKSYYSFCISINNEIFSDKKQYISEYLTESKLLKAGQRVCYWMGYSVYKLGDTASAQSYYNKAKNILNDELIQPYK